MIEDLEKKLKAPFPVESLHWRIGQRNKEKTRAEMLVYIDARDVMDRLDEVCGINWQDDYKEVNGRIVCTITIDGISKSDGAGDTNIEGDKGGISDAFKRAAVKWGIGRYLYDAGKYNTWIDIVNEKGEQIPDWSVLDFGDNKKKLDRVARLLSGTEPTPQEKAKATREENKSKIEELNERGRKRIEWLKNLKRDITPEEHIKMQELLREISSFKECEAIGNELVKEYNAKDKIKF